MDSCIGRLEFMLYDILFNFICSPFITRGYKKKLQLHDLVMYIFFNDQVYIFRCDYYVFPVSNGEEGDVS